MKPAKNLVFQAIIGMMTLGLMAAATAQALEVVKWTGCGISKKAFMLEAAKAYKKATGVTIALSGGGATKGIRDAGAGKADLGGSCRMSLPGQFPAEEGQVYMTVAAWDALVPIVNANNPVNGISTAQLKDVLTGKITNWKELGGPDHAILVVARKGKISGVGYMVRKIIFNDANVDFAPNALLVKSSGPLENKIKSDPFAIGVTGVSSANKRLAKGEPIKILKVDGSEATVENIASGSYPTFRPLFVATKGKPAGKAKAFIDWLLSDEGQTVIEAAGTVSLRQGKGLKAKYQYWENTDRIVNFDSLP